MAIVYGDEMRAGYIEHDEVFGPRVRTRTLGAGMAKLITVSEGLKRFLVKTFAIPLLCIIIKLGDRFSSGD